MSLSPFVARLLYFKRSEGLADGSDGSATRDPALGLVLLFRTEDHSMSFSCHILLPSLSTQARQHDRSSPTPHISHACRFPYSKANASISRYRSILPKPRDHVCISRRLNALFTPNFDVTSRGGAPSIAFTIHELSLFLKKSTQKS